MKNISVKDLFYLKSAINHVKKVHSIVKDIMIIYINMYAEVAQARH